MKSKTLAHEWFEEVWNKSQINAIDRLLASDAVAHGLFDEHGQELRGPAGFRPFFLQFTKVSGNGIVFVIRSLSTVRLPML